LNFKKNKIKSLHLGIKMAGYFRFLLSLLVVSSHVGLRFFRYSGNIGVVAVIIFLMLSGFVVSGLLDKANYNLKSFYIERFLRIYPLYWFITIIFTASVILINYGTPIFNPYNIFAHLSIIPLDYWWVINPFVFTSDEYQNQFMNIPIWSLGLEIQAYILLPLILKRPKIKLFCLIISFLIFNLGYSGHYLGFSTDTSVLITMRTLPGMLFFFIIGSYLYEIKNQKHSARKIVYYIYSLSLISLFTYYKLLHLNIPFIKDIFYALLVGTPLIYLISISKRKYKNAHLFGDLSYGVYISHSLGIYLIESINSLKHLSTSPTTLMISASIIAIGLSYIGIYLIDNRLKKVRINLIKNNKSTKEPLIYT